MSSETLAGVRGVAFCGLDSFSFDSRGRSPSIRNNALPYEALQSRLEGETHGEPRECKEPPGAPNGASARRALSGRALAHLLFCCAVVLSAAPARAATWYVWTNSPANGPGTDWSNAFHDIQSAVDAAQADDTVLVTNGTYSVAAQITITNGIDLRSVGGPAVTVVDGNNATRCLYLNASNAVVAGFLITHGTANDSGGGVYIGAGGTLTNCIIAGNQAANEGGGVLCRLGASVVDCVISNNSSGDDGGGVLSSGVIQGCTIVNNSAGDDAGGIQAMGGIVLDCLIARNVAADCGGGLHCRDTGVARNCVITSNRANNAMSSNAGGGGAYLREGGSMVNCLVMNNQADKLAGGVYLLTAGSLVENCTIVNNTAPRGGGIGFHHSSSLCHCYNSVVYSNTASDGPNYAHYEHLTITADSVRYCCTAPAILGGDNITNAPLFLAANDFRLTVGAPCIDSGTNLTAQGITDDFDGVSRPLDGNNDGVAKWDIGAYEFVNPQADTDHDGMKDPDEIVAGTDPTNAGSVLGVSGCGVGPGRGHVITWPSVSNRWYAVDKGTNLMEAFWLLESGIPGRPPVNSYTDAVGIAASEFYRVTVSTGWFVEGMALIPGGSNSGTNPLAAGESFDPAAYPSNYSLTVSAFYMDRCLVTKTQWDEVYNWATNQGYQFSGPGGGKGPSHPAQMATWEDCVKWCNARSEQEGRPACYRIAGNTYRTGPSAGVTCDFAAPGYRLPTDAEWEYAGRGGLTGQRYPWGDTIDRTRANYYGNPADYSYDLGYPGFDRRYNDRVYPYSSAVGSFPPNAYGLYDMAGNAWEWCWDWYPGHENSDRVVRGSSWFMDAATCRVGYRFSGKPNEKCVAVGFRTVLPASQ